MDKPNNLVKSFHASLEEEKPTYTATLHFDLAEHNADFITAINGMKYWQILWDLSQKIRNKIKYEENPPATWEEFETLFYQLLYDYNINLEEV